VPKKKINPTRVPIEKKESVRWLDNGTRPAEAAESTVDGVSRI
jgi:hypothetical protein